MAHAGIYFLSLHENAKMSILNTPNYHQCYIFHSLSTHMLFSLLQIIHYIQLFYEGSISHLVPYAKLHDPALTIPTLH